MAHACRPAGRRHGRGCRGRRDARHRPRATADRRGGRADADAWRAASSPSNWTVRSSGVSRTVRTKSGAWQVDDPNDQGGGTFNIGGLGQFTYQELQELPTDPGELRELLCEGSVELAGGRSGAPKHCDGPKSVLDQVFSVLSDTPVPPKVRAGLMRLITDYPGVRQLGTVTDPLGRPAVGLAAPFESADGRGTVQEEVLFDQRTGKVLGSRDVQLEPGPNSEKWQVPGRMLDYWVILDSGWSNARPTLPD
ncbi:MAG: CU044_5270 family protein [Streptomyces sp.]|nr:CU044_5270 family protein [Streptomyces sp.]